MAPWRDESPATAPARPGPRRAPQPAPQPPDRGGVRPVAPALHPASSQAPPARDGPARDNGLPHDARRSRSDERLDPEPGAERLVVSLSRRSATRRRRREGLSARPDSGEAPGRADTGGGPAGPRPTAGSRVARRRAALRGRAQDHRVSRASGQGRRYRAAAAHGAEGEGAEGPPGPFAGHGRAAAVGAPRGGPPHA